MGKEQIRQIVIQNAYREVESILRVAREEAKVIREKAQAELEEIKNQEYTKFRYWEQLERSKQIGKARQIEKDLILKSKHKVIADVVKKFQEEYVEILKSPEKYREIMKSLLLEAYKEVEGGDIVIYTSKKDRKLVEELLREIGIEANFKTKEEKFDGVILEDQSRGFYVYNTVEDRLERAREILLEEFSKIFLGE